MRKIAFQIATRYLFGKKTTNAINIITGISVAGITIGTCALVLVLSVFNGFHDVLFETFGSFHPDIKAMKDGLVFFCDELNLAQPVIHSFLVPILDMIVNSFTQEIKFVNPITQKVFTIKKGFKLFEYLPRCIVVAFVADMIAKHAAK